MILENQQIIVVFLRNDDIRPSTPCSHPATLQPFFLAGDEEGENDEERVRMNVTPAERRGFQAKTTSRTPLAWLLFLFALSSLLPYIHLLSFLSFFPACIPAVVHLTHDSSLRSVTGRV